MCIGSNYLDSGSNTCKGMFASLSITCLFILTANIWVFKLVPKNVMGHRLAQALKLINVMPVTPMQGTTLLVVFARSALINQFGMETTAVR